MVPFFRDYKLVILGGRDVGKSSLSVQYIYNYFLDGHDFFIEGNSRKQVIIDKEPALIDVIDTDAGQEYSALREQYMRLGEGFLLVYSITSRDSIEEISTFHEQILHAKGQDSIPIIVVANKSDLEYQRQVGIHEGRDLAKHFGNGCKFIETSAKHGFNVDEAFSDLVREVRKYEKAQKASRAALSGYRGGSPETHGGKDQCTPGCSSGCLIL